MDERIFYFMLLNFKFIYILNCFLLSSFLWQFSLILDHMDFLLTIFVALLWIRTLIYWFYNLVVYWKSIPFENYHVK